MWSAPLCLLLAAGPSGPLLTTTVPATEGRTCVAYLFAKPKARDLPLMLQMMGTGIYTTSNEGESGHITQQINDGKAALLTFDKPGIKSDPKQLGVHVVDDAVYNEYTHADLEACAKGSLEWATRQSMIGRTKPIVINGHSEGAIIASRLLLTLHEVASPVLPRISLLALSGVPAGDMKEIIKLQVDRRNDWEKFERALETRDNTYLRQWGSVGAATLLSFFRGPSLARTFETLASHRPRARISIHHGRRDQNTPLAMVEALITDNTARRDAGEPALELYLHDYDAPHGLNATAQIDLVLWITQALEPHGLFSKLPSLADKPLAIPVDDKTLSALVGRYRVDAERTMEITREGTRIFAQLTGQRRFPIFQDTPGHLVERGDPTFAIRFERTQDRIEAITVVQNGESLCPRVESPTPAA